MKALRRASIDSIRKLTCAISSLVLPSPIDHNAAKVNFAPGSSYKASSQLNSYGPGGLFWAAEPGWHAAANPAYPQILDVEFHETQVIHTIKFLPQDEASDRAPKNVDIKFSVDGKSWTSAGRFGDICTANTAEGWRDVTLAPPINARYVQIAILNNCGNPDFLTLRGLKFE